MAAMPVRSGVSSSFTVAALPTLLVPAASRQEHSSNTWTSSNTDMALLSDNDEVESRDTFVQDYNKLAAKYGIRLMVPLDYETTSYVAPQPEKRRWFSRRRDSATRLPSGKSEKSVTLKSSIGDLSTQVGQGKGDPRTDRSLQGLVRLCGKSFLYLPAEYTPGSLVIPTCLRATAQYLVQHGPQARGVFRVPGSVRAVNALHDYYFADSEGGSSISGTVRAPNLPTHLEYGVHDVASTFKKLLAGLPGGILGSLSVFDALVAVHSQLDGDPEANRTKKSKIRARLIALAIGTITSHFQRELVCAVFGLLCLIGRASETTRREDSNGRPLPTSDLMGYNALGIIFGPLLVGNLIDQYSMKVAAPSNGLVLLPVTPPPSRKDKSKRRAVSDGRPVTPITVDKILVANSIAEMLIANWREITKNLKSLGAIVSTSSYQIREAPSTRSLRTSASESALSANALRPPPRIFGDKSSAMSRQNRENKGSMTTSRQNRDNTLSSDREDELEDLTVKKQRENFRPRKILFAMSPPAPGRTPIEGGATRRALVKPRPGSKGAIAGGSSTQHSSDSGTIVPTPSAPYVGINGASTTTTAVAFPNLLFSGGNRERKTGRKVSSPLSDFGPSSTDGRDRPARGETTDTSSNGILSKAHRVLKAKLTSGHRTSRVHSPPPPIPQRPRTATPDQVVHRRGAVRHEVPLARHEERVHRLRASRSGDKVASGQESPTTKAARRERTSSGKNGQGDLRDDIDSTRDTSRTRHTTGKARLVPRAKADELVVSAMVGRSNALRQQQRLPKSMRPGVSVSEDTPTRDIAGAEGTQSDMAGGLFHMGDVDVTALRERGSPTPVDTNGRGARKFHAGLLSEEHVARSLQRSADMGLTHSHEDLQSVALRSNVEKARPKNGIRRRENLEDSPHIRNVIELVDTEVATALTHPPAKATTALAPPPQNVTATPAPPPATPHFSSTPGTAMRRKHVSVSGGNVKAMAAIFENAAKETKGSPEKKRVSAVADSSSVTTHGDGTSAVLCEYVRNPTPPRSLRSSKSWKSDDVSSCKNSERVIMNETMPEVARNADGAPSEAEEPGVLHTGGHDAAEQGDDTLEVLTQEETSARWTPALPTRNPSRSNYYGPPKATIRHVNEPAEPTHAGQNDKFTLRPRSESVYCRQSCGQDPVAAAISQHVSVDDVLHQLEAKIEECTQLREDLAATQSASAAAGSAAQAVATLTDQLRRARRDAKFWRDEAETWKERAEATGRRLAMIHGALDDGPKEDDKASGSAPALRPTARVPTPTAVAGPRKGAQQRGLQKRQATAPLRRGYQQAKPGREGQMGTLQGGEADSDGDEEGDVRAETHCDGRGSTSSTSTVLKIDRRDSGSSEEWRGSLGGFVVEDWRSSAVG